MVTEEFRRRLAAFIKHRKARLDLFAEKLQSLMDARNVPAEWVAQETGIELEEIRDYLSGATVPQRELWLLFLVAFDVKPSELFPPVRCRLPDIPRPYGVREYEVYMSDGTIEIAWGATPRIAINAAEISRTVHAVAVEPVFPLSRETLTHVIGKCSLCGHLILDADDWREIDGIPRCADH